MSVLIFNVTFTSNCETRCKDILTKYSKAPNVVDYRYFALCMSKMQTRGLLEAGLVS